MKHKRILSSSILALALLSAMPCALAQSDVPGSMSYQGRISDQTGALVGSPTPVNRTVIFRVWNSASATAPANLLYSEQQVVTIANGEFNVLVGQGLSVPGEEAKKVAFDTVFNGAERFLGVTVDNGDGNLANDPEITPRQQLVTSAFAFRARTAEQVPDSAITSSMLAAGAVTADSIAPNTINNTKLAAGAALSNIAANSIDGTKLAPGTALANIADNTITGSKIENGGVGLADLAANSVDSSKIVDGSITAADIANGTVTPAKLDSSIGLWTANGANVSRSGNVGIGTGTTPPQSPLTFPGAVGPAISLTNNTQHYGLGLGPGTLQVVSPAGIDLGVGISPNITVTMRLTDTGNVLVRGTLTSSAAGLLSDARIKSIVGRSNSDSDLKLIRKLQVTDYRMIDKTTLGDGVQRGFIAQEVQKIMPEAVKEMPKHLIPSIYAPATKAIFDPATKSLRIILEKEHGLNKGDTVQLKDDKQSWEVNVAETIDATTFVAGPVDAPISEVFVYGKVVDDMLSVDYNRLFTTGIGAIQDLAKQVESIKAENAELRAKLAASEQRFEELEAADKSRDARLVAIEKMLRTSDTIVVTAKADHKQTEN